MVVVVVVFAMFVVVVAAAVVSAADADANAATLRYSQSINKRNLKRLTLNTNHVNETLLQIEKKAFCKSRTDEE